MNLKAGNAGLERGLMVLGIVLMVVGILGAFLVYVASRNYGNQLDVGSAIAQTVAWLTLVLIGAVLFLRYSLGRHPAHVAAAPALRGPGQHRSHRRRASTSKG